MLAGADDLGAVVDVDEEAVERPDALLDARSRAVRHSVSVKTRGMMSKGISRSVVLALAVDGEGDADAPEQRLGLLLLQRDGLGRRVRAPTA